MKDAKVQKEKDPTTHTHALTHPLALTYICVYDMLVSIPHTILHQYANILYELEY
jgi:hypothetical protein